MRQIKSTIATTAAAQGLLGRPPLHAVGFDGEDEGTLSKEEADKLKRSIAEKDREVRDLKKADKERDEKIDELESKLEDASTGDDEKKQLEQRLDRLEKQGKKAEEEAKTAKSELADSKRETAALAVAARLKFRNPARAIKLLDLDDLDNEDDTERALEALAKEEPGMVTSKKQRPVDDPPKPKGEGGEDDEDDDNPPKGKSEDEPTGTARLRGYYEKKAKEEAKDKGGDGGEGESD